MKVYDLLVLIEKDEDGSYVATVPALKSCYTQAIGIFKIRILGVS